MEKLQKKYGQWEGVTIQYCQLAEHEVAEPLEEKSICLFIKTSGTIVTYELQCNGLEEQLQKKLWSTITPVLEGDAEDFEKCKQYFQLAYQIIEEALSNQIR